MIISHPERFQQQYNMKILFQKIQNMYSILRKFQKSNQEESNPLS